MNFSSVYLNEKQIAPEEVEIFKQKQLKLNGEIQKELTEDNRAPIGDGALNYEGYLKAKIKILWLMKEPYDTNKGVNVTDVKTGGWYFTDTMFKEKNFGRDRTTWYPIINTSHALLSEQPVWNQNVRMSANNKSLIDVLSHIGYINIQKLASKTREQTNNTIINEAFKANKEWIQKQIDLLNPDIIIGANTLNGDVFVHFGLKGKMIKKTESNEGYLANGKLFIRANHPAQRGIKSKVYVNDILSLVQEWRKTNSNAIT